MLIYLHGFQSSPRSAKAWDLGNFVAAQGRRDFIAPALPDRPMAAADLMRELVSGMTEPVCLIGSSLGGFYAHWLAEVFNVPAILINPAIAAPQLMQSRIGAQYNPYTGQHYQIHALDVAVWQAMATPMTNPGRYWLLQQAGDEVLDYRVAVDHFKGAKVTLEAGGSHRFDHFERWLPEILAFADSQAVRPSSPV